MTSNANLFCTYAPFKTLISISLANGGQVPAIEKGNVSLTANLQLHDVLLVPTFTMSLLSVPKLCTHSNCQIIFTATYCIFQDTRSRQEIGHALSNGSLYFLQLSHPVTPTAALGTSFTAQEWHTWLGHPSPHKLQLMILSQLRCDSCQLAKHVPFLCSLNLGQINCLSYYPRC